MAQVTSTGVLGGARKPLQLPDHSPQALLLPQHRAFIVKYSLHREDYEYVMSEFLRMNGVYWSLTAVDLMHAADQLDRTEILDFVRACFDPVSGGFAPAPRHDPHILYTLSAVQIAATLDALDMLDVPAIVRYVCSLQRDDGSFTGDRWGEVDNRFSFCAAACLTLLGRLADMNVERAACRPGGPTG
eukprot:maker-scaffold1494_size38455-snap-gene-0.11 protein:Tk08020 transcript:maker-scaffold1494_size38455-snap-gene-0.11-mRNA-1 annotation:"hypothetical protein CAPTEDRAFT_118195"